MALYSALPTEVPSTRLREVRVISRAKRLIAEEIGLEGASKYAIETRCEPLYMGKARQGAGFDLVFRDGNRIKVIEAKGGGSQVKRFGGHWQGTPEYTRGVAEDVLARSSASEDEKAAAKEVLKAMEEGGLILKWFARSMSRASLCPLGSKVRCLSATLPTLLLARSRASCFALQARQSPLFVMAAKNLGN